MIFCSITFFALIAAGQNQPEQKLELQFQSAVAQYRAGNFANAASQLELLMPAVPKSFEVHELLGLVYAAQASDAKAAQQLALAVRLKPDSAAARTNLAAALLRSGDAASALQQFRKALELEPRDYDANHNLGEFYIQSGKIADAVPLLEKARQIEPASYNNGYDLALAYSLTGKLDQAKQLTQTLLSEKNSGELHNLLGQIEEKKGNYLPAVNEFETAAHIDPSEENIFAWGSELLLHRTYEPAITVFEQGTLRYPRSPRLFIGLGMALSARAKYDDAIKALLQAADLNPADARCYRFLSHAYDLAANPSDEVVHRFRRFAELQPHNAWASYYYAMSLMKGNRPDAGSEQFQQVEALLKKSISNDDHLAEVHLQLGILYAGEHDEAKAFPQYVRALEIDPDSVDAHYRLGQYYVRAGRKDLAQQEIDTYQKLRAKYLANLDKEGNEVQQFVYSAGSSLAHKP